MEFLARALAANFASGLFFFFVHGSVGVLGDLGCSFARLPLSDANRGIQLDLYFDITVLAPGSIV